MLFFTFCLTFCNKNPDIEITQLREAISRALAWIALTVQAQLSPPGCRPHRQQPHDGPWLFGNIDIPPITCFSFSDPHKSTLQAQYPDKYGPTSIRNSGGQPRIQTVSRIATCNLWDNQQGTNLPSFCESIKSAVQVREHRSYGAYTFTARSDWQTPVFRSSLHSGMTKFSLSNVITKSREGWVSHLCWNKLPRTAKYMCIRIDLNSIFIGYSLINVNFFFKYQNLQTGKMAQGINCLQVLRAEAQIPLQRYENARWTQWPVCKPSTWKVGSGDLWGNLASQTRKVGRVLLHLSQ